MARHHLSLTIALLGLLAAAPAVQAQGDVKGSKDHPLVTRMPGFYLASYNVEEFAVFDPTVIGFRWTEIRQAAQRLIDGVCIRCILSD